MFDRQANIRYTVASNERRELLQKKSRADYFRERRKEIGQFNISVSREKLNALDEKLKSQGKTKTKWLNEKIDEEIRE